MVTTRSQSAAASSQGEDSTRGESPIQPENESPTSPSGENPGEISSSEDPTLPTGEISPPEDPTDTEVKIPPSRISTSLRISYFD
jgi:hypothetical protein